MERLLTVRNPCSRGKIESCYRPIVAAATTAYRETAGTSIREIWLMGSVARGDALAPFSDIDFIALLSDEPTAQQTAMIAERAAHLTERFDCVSEVDLEAVALESLGEARRSILKCLRRHALLAGATYERTVEAIRNQLCVYMPEHVSLVDALYELYIRPEPSKERILSVLLRADAELLKP